MTQLLNTSDFENVASLRNASEQGYSCERALIPYFNILVMMIQQNNLILQQIRGYVLVFYALLIVVVFICLVVIIRCGYGDQIYDFFRNLWHHVVRCFSRIRRSEVEPTVQRRTSLARRAAALHRERDSIELAASGHQETQEEIHSFRNELFSDEREEQNFDHVVLQVQAEIHNVPRTPSNVLEQTHL